jgi:NAD(P)-dependent dehydrogenase (short-subunit alcohol dehydrogenase family)
MTPPRKVYLVAGVGGGLGSAVVQTLAADGAAVVGAARNRKVLDLLVAKAKARGWEFSAHPANFLRQANVDRLIEQVVKQYGHLDGVSVNAGRWVGGESMIHKMSETEWSDAIDQNLDPIYRVARAVLPHMMEQGSGSIVAVSAALPVRWAGSASYCAAKGGLADMIPKLARDYRPYGVRFNAVLPGSMSSDLRDADPPAAGKSVRLADEPSVSPWEVARAIRYLLSDEAQWVTGATLVVDGGASTGGAEPRARKK